MQNAALSFDKRMHPRAQAEIPVKYKVINQSEEALAMIEQRKSIQEGNSKDISAEGLFLVTERSLAKGDILKVEVQLPEEPQPIRAFSEVVWTQPHLSTGKCGSGIYFMALRDEDSDKMKRYVARLLNGN